MTIDSDQTFLLPPEVVEAYQRRGYWQEETLGECLCQRADQFQAAAAE